MAPSFTLKGHRTAAYGNYNDKELRGYVTGPLSDQIAVLVSGGWQDRQGFFARICCAAHMTRPAVSHDQGQGAVPAECRYVDHPGRFLPQA